MFLEHQNEKQIQNVNDQREPGETIENDPKENNIKDQHNIGKIKNHKYIRLNNKSKPNFYNTGYPTIK